MKINNNQESINIIKKENGLIEVHTEVASSVVVVQDTIAEVAQIATREEVVRVLLILKVAINRGVMLEAVISEAVTDLINQEAESMLKVKKV